MNKISAEHLSRQACVYIRQSTQDQVQNNLESKRRQYALVDRARTLGWEDVQVIDEDLGTSGSATIHRAGFERLLAGLCDGKVGAVLSVEASRLARNGRDWHTLLEFCSVVGARQTACTDILVGVNYFFRRIASLEEATRPAVIIVADQTSDVGEQVMAEALKVATWAPTAEEIERERECEERHAKLREDVAAGRIKLNPTAEEQLAIDDEKLAANAPADISQHDGIFANLILEARRRIARRKAQAA